MNTKQIKLSDFSFELKEYGHYKVTYTSLVTGKQWSYTTTNMQLIDATKNSENPLKCNLELLKKYCKS
ncbi:MAG TPA: hypothetical protein VIK86_01275 [Candidatus Paceibacterota bacterium]